MISAGFDAHRRDPLAGVLLTDEDFGMLAKGVLKAADSLCDGKVVSVLEGGYDLEGLSGGVEQLIRAQLAYS
jgi:acetoin utilization deacetylase AcuC-like enzyme